MKKQSYIVLSKKDFKGTEFGKKFSRTFSPKKELSRKVIKFADEIMTPKTLERFGDCAKVVSHLTNEEMSVKKVAKAQLCGNRFCPVCSWNKSKKDALMIAVMMQAVKEMEGQEFIMMTLTSKNVIGDDLRSEIDKFNAAFNKLFKRRGIVKAVNGYIRKLEVTTDQNQYITEELYKRKKKYYDAKGLGVGDPNPTYKTYNPHFHAILSVNKSYFTSRDYIKRDDWLKYWQECMEDMSITQVDVRKVRAGEKSEMDAVLEVAKYSAKSTDLYHSKSVFQTFYLALKNRQLITFNGLFKKYKKLYMSGELDHYKNQDDTEYTHMLDSYWKKSMYEHHLRKLSEEEYKEYNDLAKEIDAKKLEE